MSDIYQFLVYTSCTGCLPRTGTPWGLLMTTTSLSWYSMLLWRCLASTLGWTFCSCRLNRFSSITLLCCPDTAASAAWNFVFSCRTLRARSIALSRGFSPVSEPGACLEAVVWLQLRDGAACGHRWELVRGLTREKRVLKPELQSPVQAVLLQMFIVVQPEARIDMRNIHKLKGSVLCSTLNHFPVIPSRIKVHNFILHTTKEQKTQIALQQF